MLVLIIDHMGLVVGVVHDMPCNVDKLDPLLFWRRVPAREEAIVKRADNLVERIFFNLAVMTAWIRVLWIKG